MPISTLVCTLLAYTAPGLEIQVDGAGLLRFAREGRAVYAKKATFAIASGHLTAGGCDLLPAVTVPAGAVAIDVDLEGNLYAVRTGVKSKIGKLVLAMFANESALTADGKFLIAQDRPTLGEAGQDLFGVIRKAGGESKPLPNIKPIAQPPSSEQVQPRVPSVTAPKKGGVAPYKSNQKIKVDMPVITIRLENEAKGDKILLGEVADVIADPDAKKSLESAPVGDTPSIGVSRGLDAITLTSALSRAGWKLGTYVLNMAPGAKVRRQCQQVTDEKFVQTAIEAATTQLKILAPMHSDIAQPPLSCPLGEVSLKVENCGKTGLGATVSIGIYVDGRRINSRIVQLSPDKDAVGVSQGQRVKVMVRAAGATVELSGKAKEQAWAGQTVSIETDTGAVLTGKVTSDGSVEVTL